MSDGVWDLLRGGRMTLSAAVGGDGAARLFAAGCPWLCCGVALCLHLLTLTMCAERLGLRWSVEGSRREPLGCLALPGLIV